MRYSTSLCIALFPCASGCESRRSAPPTTPHPAAKAPAPSPQPSSSAPPAVTATNDDDLFRELEGDGGAMPQPVAACFELRGAKDCAGSGIVMMGCNALMHVFEQDVGDQFLKCLVAANGSDPMCGAGILKTCGLSSIKATPPLSAVGTICDELFQKCPVPEEFRDVYTATTCRAGLSSLRERPRRDFIECMRHRCDLKMCVSELF